MSLLKDRLKETRLEAKLSQQTLADKAGVSQTTIASIEAGEQKGAKNLAAIAAVLGVEALWLETGKGPKRRGSTATLIDHGVPPHVLALAQKLALVPEEKLKAISVLLGLKL